jgi:hypothetical protein
MQGHEKRSNHRGISLLDTLCAMTIASGLTATAAPHLMQWPAEARKAVITHTAGAMRSASTLHHMKCAVSPQCPLQQGSTVLTVGAVQVHMQDGHPAAGHDEGLARALEIDGLQVVQAPFETRVQHPSAPAPARCAAVYRSPPAPGLSPEVVALTDGC